MNRALINASSGIVQKPLRYVLYVRKSSEDAEAQAKSLPDQIADCKEYANNHGLLLVGEPIQESKSAKKSGNRPLFSQMLKDIEKGKYDAILAWHPDRLSRNSLEAGMVVDMVDNGVIKDLRFPTFEFHNDSSGKLTLNMLFAPQSNIQNIYPKARNTTPSPINARYLPASSPGKSCKDVLKYLLGQVLLHKHHIRRFSVKIP